MREQQVDPKIKNINWKLFLLGLFKIPLVGFVRPKVVHINDQRASICIPLNRRTRNHLNSMYFGTLCVGADIAAGIFVFYLTEKMQLKNRFVFKSMQVEFLKRANSEVYFECEDGQMVRKIIEKAMQTKEREEQIVWVKAFDKERELVAKFQMELSIKIL